MRTLYDTLFLILSVIVFAALAEAHPGSLARDGCHKDNAVGERHYHVNDTAERAGACLVDEGGQVYRQPEAPTCEPQVVMRNSVDVQAFEDSHKRVLADIRKALDRPPRLVKVEVEVPALKPTTEKCRHLRAQFESYYDRWGNQSEAIALDAINAGCW